MNCFFGLSLTGTSHISRKIPCQDAHKISEIDGNWVVAAIADGVGSAKHSDIASNLAVNNAVDFCLEKLNHKMNIDEIKVTLLEAYRSANNAISDRAEKDGNPITQYDTTLSMIIFAGTKVVYGHAGDGGIVGLSKDGYYKKITKPQKDEDGIFVIPLRSGENSWEFGVAEGEYTSVLLATDGVYDTFFPYLLRGQENEIYVPLIRYFLDNNVLRMDGHNTDNVKTERENFLLSDGYASVTDDKTVVVVVNTEQKPALLNEEYYAEPNWDKLQQEWNKKAYPNLYKDIKNEEK